MGKRVQIEILAGPGVGENFAYEDPSILIGRGSQCTMQIASPHVSRQQCELSWQGDQLVLENLGSVNVTYLNDRPIERVFVQDGDLVTFCDVAVRIRIPRGEGVAQDPDRTVAFPKGQAPPFAGGPAPSKPQMPPAPQPAPTMSPHLPPSGMPPGMPPAGMPAGPGMGPGARPPGPAPSMRDMPPMPPAPSMPQMPAMSRGAPARAPSMAAMPPLAQPGPAQMAPHPTGVDTHPPGPLPGGPAPRPQPVPGALGTGYYPPLAPGQAPPPAARIPAHGGPAPGSMVGMPPLQGMPPGMPGAPARPGLATTGTPRRPPRPGDASMDGRAQKPRRRKGKPGGGMNIQQVRNIVLAVSAVLVLLSLAWALGNRGGTPAKKSTVATSSGQKATPDGAKGGSATPAADKAVPVVPTSDRRNRTDEEILAEARRLFGVGSRYYGEYQVADENLWTAREYFLKSKAELLLIPAEQRPEYTAELDRKLGHVDELLENEFRRIRLAFVREFQAGNYDRALEELERIQRTFPEKTDERNDYARKREREVRAKMAGGKKWGFGE
jgi:hypothetical protein